MRIAAGIILIVAAIMNIFAGAGYVLGGGLATVGGMAADELNKQAQEAGTATDENTKALTEAAATASGHGTFWLAFGVFLWLLFILQIIGAVFLFISKSKMFIFIIAALSVIAEIVGIVSWGFGWTNTFGIVGGILAFIGAMSIGTEAAPAAPAAPAA